MTVVDLMNFLIVDFFDHFESMNNCLIHCFWPNVYSSLNSVKFIILIPRRLAVAKNDVPYLFGMIRNLRRLKSINIFFSVCNDIKQDSVRFTASIKFMHSLTLFSILYELCISRKTSFPTRSLSGGSFDPTSLGVWFILNKFVVRINFTIKSDFKTFFKINVRDIQLEYFGAQNFLAPDKYLNKKNKMKGIVEKKLLFSYFSTLNFFLKFFSLLSLTNSLKCK
ncbi:hypothetical protein BpHYR1_053850 [Brachionus plicatilis]|uniref:Uncharacterized protein n=1 Tax=Brachionus plicatilis TaxID=10195 RepID=A0A3M7Q6L4_BRAPC|nr:hypothetical protein BpHYR1_053850 [Brachionus plicatilis]